MAPKPLLNRRNVKHVKLYLSKKGWKLRRRMAPPAYIYIYLSLSLSLAVSISLSLSPFCLSPSLTLSPYLGRMAQLLHKSGGPAISSSPHSLQKCQWVQEGVTQKGQPNRAWEGSRHRQLDLRLYRKHRGWHFRAVSIARVTDQTVVVSVTNQAIDYRHTASAKLFWGNVALVVFVVDKWENYRHPVHRPEVILGIVGQILPTSAWKLWFYHPFKIITRMNSLFPTYLWDYSFSFQASFESISITVTVSLFFQQNAVTGSNFPQEFSRIFCNYSYNTLMVFKFKI